MTLVQPDGAHHYGTAILRRDAPTTACPSMASRR